MHDSGACHVIIPQADVICIVYAVNDEGSFTAVRERWLPLIRRARSSDGDANAAPVLLVGNKVCSLACTQ